MNTPKVRDLVLFGTHIEGNTVRFVPALVGMVRESEMQENGYPTLDLCIFHAYRHENGWASHVKGFDKLRVGGWSLSEETDPAAIGQQLMPETRSPSDLAPKLEAPKDPTGPQGDPQTDGVPNVFGGVTRYNPAVNRQMHTDDRGRTLYICATCKEPKWYEPKAKLVLDGSCCSDNIKRRAPGVQADPSWLLWRKPDDSVLVGHGPDESDNADGVE